MTRCEDSIEQIQAALKVVACTAILFVPLSLHAKTLEEKQAARQERIGLQIASTPGYTVHADTAIRQGGKVTCETGTRRADIQAESDRLEVLKRAVTQERDEKLAKLTARMGDRSVAQKAMQEANELNQRYRRGEMTLEEYKTIQKQMQDQARERFIRIQQEMDAVEEDYGARYEAITKKQKALWQNNSAGRLTITLLHQSVRPTDTIVPMKGNQPTAEFVKELKQELEPFISTCKEANFAYIAHYYKDAYRYGEKDTPVIGFRYNIVNGKLKLITCDTPSCKEIAALAGRSGQTRNPELTLAGFIKAENAKAIEAAEYRKAFAYQAGRQDGIVYKLDPYWAQYEDLDTARRIFDGDFSHSNTRLFKYLFVTWGNLYSNLCVTDKSAKDLYQIPVREYMGMETHLDGSMTKYYQDRLVDVWIDKRFSPQWGQYRPESNLYYMTKVLTNTQAKGFGQKVLSGMSVKQFFETIQQGSRDMLAELLQLRDFLTSNTCRSASVQQMTENFIRAANNRPSAQQSGKTFTGAKKESDPPTKTGTPPPAFTSMTVDAQSSDKAVKSTISVFGGDRKTPEVSKEEFNREVEHVTDQEHGDFKNAAQDAEKALNRQKQTRRQGSTSAPKTRVTTTQDDTQQAAQERTKRNRQIDADANREIMDLTNTMHAKQLKDAERFRQNMMAATTNEERAALLEEYKARQRDKGEALRKQVQDIRAAANGKKTQP